MIINHINLSRKVFKQLKNVARKFIQVLLLDHYMCAHAVIRLGLEKVFTC